MNRIRQLREEREWNQDYLGTLLKVKRAAVSKYETEKIPLTKDTILELTKIFDVSADYLLNNSETRKPNTRPPSAAEASKLLKNKFIQHGIIKEGEDITDEQLDNYLKKLKTIIDTFKE